jgi:3-oxoadipate enol-lactonase
MGPALADQSPHSTHRGAETALRWVVMVHGVSHDCSYFSSQALYFENAYRLLLIDLPGHGSNSDSPGPYGVEEYADAVSEAIDQARVEGAHFWGSHTGAAIGLILSLRQPERFTSLILEGTFLPGFPMSHVVDMTDMARSISREGNIARARGEWLSRSEWFAHMRAHPQETRAREHSEMLTRFNCRPWLDQSKPRPVSAVSDRLSEVRQPALIYNGVNDAADFRLAADYLELHLKQVRRCEIEKAGGFPAWENPLAVRGLVAEFLRDAEASEDERRTLGRLASIRGS